MEKSVQNILVVSESTSYIITSIAQQLEELKYHTIKVNSDADEINKVKESLSAMLVYVDEVVLENMQT